MATVHTHLHDAEEMAKADAYYADRRVKRIPWMQGSFRDYASGDRSAYENIKTAYQGIVPILRQGQQPLRVYGQCKMKC